MNKCLPLTIWKFTQALAFLQTCILWNVRRIPWVYFPTYRAQDVRKMTISGAVQVKAILYTLPINVVYLIHPSHTSSQWQFAAWKFESGPGHPEELWVILVQLIRHDARELNSPPDLTAHLGVISPGGVHSGLFRLKTWALHRFWFLRFFLVAGNRLCLLICVIVVIIRILSFWKKGFHFNGSDHFNAKD